jgi:hypothetical protein
MQNETLNVLLGAGFSFNAGLPMAAAIAKKFNRDYTDQLCRLESQWFWTEGKDDVFKHNGSLDSDVPTMPFIMNEIVSEYSKLMGELNNYELFYAFLLEQKEDFFKPLVERAKVKFFEKFPDMPPEEIYTDNFNSFGRWKVIELVNYLIADLLQSNKTDDELVAAYQPFIALIQRYDQVNIYTTNHDLILERMLTKLGIRFDDGFAKMNTELIHHDTKNPIATFQNSFSKPGVNIIKVHGSIDMIRYTKNDVIDGNLTYTGYLYFKPESRDEMHYPARINVKTLAIIQTPPNTILPMFITGVDKLKRLLGDEMYSVLMEQMNNEFSLPADVLIVGYSYSDDHINEAIKKIPRTSSIRSINPSAPFPFEDFKNVKSFKTMEAEGALG